MELTITESKTHSILKIDVGTLLQIEIDGVTSRFKSELIGMSTNEYLLAKLPQIVDQDFEERCNERRGSITITRYLYRGTVFGFKSKFIGIISHPIKILIVEYPKKIEECNLRKHKRLSCLLPAKVKLNNTVFDVSILDISQAGCQIMVIDPVILNSNLLSSLSVGNSIFPIMMNLPGINENFVVNGVIKSLRNESNKVGIGTEFHKLDEHSISIINQFINISSYISLRE